MQKIVSQIPELAQHLSHFKVQDHFKIIKSLILTGLAFTKPPQIGISFGQNNDNKIITQISKIKQDIQSLNHFVKCQNCHCDCCIHPNNTTTNNNKKILQNNINLPHSIKQNNKKNNQIPVQDNQSETIYSYHPNVATKTNIQSRVNPFAKTKHISRHHLDDTQVRQAMIFDEPYQHENKVNIKRKSQQYKQHIYQQQINTQQIKKIKQQKHQILDNSQRYRASSDYTYVTSKIKNKTDRDRLKHLQKVKQIKQQQEYNKYQYSDQNQMQDSQTDQKKYQISENKQNIVEQRKLKENSNRSSQQRQLRTSQKKQVRQSLQYQQNQIAKQFNKIQSQNKKINSDRRSESEVHEDINQSSSFSEFSMNGSRYRQVGKISRKRQL